jgi:hypothetical protein
MPLGIVRVIVVFMPEGVVPARKRIWRWYVGIQGLKKAFGGLPASTGTAQCAAERR